LLVDIYSIDVLDYFTEQIELKFPNDTNHLGELAAVDRSIADSNLASDAQMTNILTSARAPFAFQAVTYTIIFETKLKP
jgi:hypothetical protein